MACRFEACALTINALWTDFGGVGHVHSAPATLADFTTGARAAVRGCVATALRSYGCREAQEHDSDIHRDRRAEHWWG